MLIQENLSLGGCFFILLYYLPIYFQSVQSVSAAQSGIRNLPLIIMMSLSSPQSIFSFLLILTILALSVIIGGGFVTALGYFTPLMIFGVAIATVGSGLIYTLSTTSSPAHWVGYQIVAGVGIGACFQVPIMAGQAIAASEDVSITTSMLLCRLPFPQYLLHHDK